MIFFKPNFWDKNKISIYSIFLSPVSIVIQLLYFLRNFLKKSNKSPIPVICVGNIYLGSTGKTPFCIELYDILKSLNKKPAFIRKKNNSYKDEKNLLERTGAVYESINRFVAIKNAFRSNYEVAILDDGFQDSSIEKNLSIVCFNANQWIGNGLTIPSGPLREGLSALKRANCVIINGEKNTSIENKILDKNKNIKIFYTKYIAENLNDFKNKKIVSFAGIGNPINFFNLLKNNQMNVVEQISYPDHYNYSKKDLETLVKKSEEHNVTLLTTEKDYLRIDKNYRNSINYLKIKTVIDNKSKFVEELKKFI